MIKQRIVRTLYHSFFKPVAFSLDAEYIHDRITGTGEFLENFGPLVSVLLACRDSRLRKKVLGIEFENPIGLSAGFDYDGHLARVLKYVGFGFNTVGTVTAKPYQGNSQPRLERLPKSKSLLVNKGFKSEGAKAVAKRLDKKNLKGHTLGVSVGSTNTPQIDTVSKAIDDYLFTFDVFKNKKYVSYFELNISCPNVSLEGAFTNPASFRNLAKAVSSLKLKQPIFVKMPNEIEFDNSDKLVKEALEMGIRGFIFSNLVKDRKNPAFDNAEILKFKDFQGNFSGKPSFASSNKLIAHARKKFGSDIAIIGSGGVFSAQDAMEKFAAGADLVQLITGMIFEGPQLIGEICKGLTAKAEKLEFNNT